MIKIFATDKVKELDKYTIEHEPIRSIDLVERAAQAFVHEFCRHYDQQKRVVVFAGQGNNGADALAIARRLLNEAYHVEVYLFNPTNHLSPDCEENKRRLLCMERVEFVEVVSDFDPPLLSNRDVVVDGLFGSGLNRPLTGGFAAVVTYINHSESDVVSIDIPSGLFGEDNRHNNMEAVVKADRTLTFGFPKLAFFLPENGPYVGEWKELNIGLHPDIVASTDTSLLLVEEEDIRCSLKPRGRFTHKGNYGHALLVAGSKGKVGAALLSARACLRSGVGLLTAYVPARAEVIMQTALPEAMLAFDPNDDHFSTVPEVSAYSAIGIGPGLGTHLDSASALDRLLQTYRKPMVLDADAINLLASNRDLLNHIPPFSILTPHPKEFDRIVGDTPCSFERLQKAKSFAAEHRVVVVLKGAYTAVCMPSGNVFFNRSGNPGMATAGSGDVLTGIILGLLAQGYEPGTAAVVGVYLHGVAGDLAASVHSQEAMLSGDITLQLGKVFKLLK